MTLEKEEIETLAQAVAQELEETEKAPIQQIEQIIEHMGRDFVQENLEETKRIQEKDGLKTDDGTRKRTTGGVFFYIVKGKMPAEIRQEIFPNFGQKDKGKIIEWDERHDYVDDLLDAAEHGNMRYVQIVLHGRPGKVVVEDNSVITTISHLHKQTPLPRGVPHPPDEPTLYTVYMAIKQWQEVEEALNTYKGDRLIVEGSAFFDAETESIAVFANRVTTRRLEKQAKQQDTDETQADSNDEDTEAEPQAELTQLEKLQNAAETLRERIADMEAKGQRGVAMTKKLLANTEKQIEALERQAPK